MTNDRHKTWTLLFEPLGVLLFRDDRPFDAGQHSLAVSRFPLPSVFRGAVRTALFLAADAEFDQPNFKLASLDQALLGGATHRDDAGVKRVTPEAFEIRGPLVAHQLDGGRYEYVLPWPRDLVVTAQPGDRPTTLRAEVMHPRRPQAHGSTRMRLASRSAGSQSRQFEPIDQTLPWTCEPHLPKFHGKPWLTMAGARAYVERSTGADPTVELVQEKDRIDWIEESDFLDKEKRVGIARATQTGGDRLVAADSMIYTMLAWRMSPRFRFAVEVDLGGIHEQKQVERLEELLVALSGRLVRLGGKSGHARVEVLEPSQCITPDWAQPDPKKASPSSKLWLWTPGLYDPGTTPGLEALLGDTLQLGGFDMANHRPRPLQGALDRGSVLWFSGLDHQALLEHQHQLAKTHDLPVPSYGCGHWISRSNQ